VRLSERRRDSSLRDTGDLGDLRVGEISEVAQEDDKAATRRKRAHRGSNVIVRRRSMYRRLLFVELPLPTQLAALLKSDVERNLPNPGLETPVAAELPLLAQRPGESLLDDLTCKFMASDHAGEDVAKRSVTISVELFEGGCVSIHLYLQISEAAVSFSAGKVPQLVREARLTTMLSSTEVSASISASRACARAAASSARRLVPSTPYTST